MPQPLPKHINVSDVRGDSDAYSRHPAIVAGMMEVIGLWSQIDGSLVLIVSLMLEADFYVVHDMLSAINGADVRRRVIVAAAKRALKGDDLSLFVAIESCLNSAKASRNRYAHWRLAYSDKLKDMAILIEPIALTSKGPPAAAFVRAIASKEDPATILGKLPAIAQSFSANRDHYHVLSEAEVKRDVRDAKKALKWLAMLDQLLLALVAGGEDSGILRQRLLAEPRIKEAFLKSTKRNTSI